MMRMSHSYRKIDINNNTWKYIFGDLHGGSRFESDKNIN